MVCHKGLTVSLRNGVDGPLMEEYDCESRTNTRSIEAIEGATICPEINIHPDFNWHNADGLYVAIRYGAEPYEILLWVPDPFYGKALVDRVNWTFKVPGKDEWDHVKQKQLHYVYQFCQARTWSCGRDCKDDCPDLKNGKAQYLSTIWISIKRKSLSEQIPLSNIHQQCQWANKSSSRLCGHYLELHRKDGPSFCITRKEAKATPLRGGVILNPEPGAFKDLKAPEGYWVNSTFAFRHRDQLRKVIGESTVQVSSLRHKAPQYRPPQITEEAEEAVEGRTHLPRGTSRSLGPSCDTIFQPLMEEQTSIRSSSSEYQSASTSLADPTINEEMSKGSHEGSQEAFRRNCKRRSSATSTTEASGVRTDRSESMPPPPKRPQLDEPDLHRSIKSRHDRSMSPDPTMSWPSDTLSGIFTASNATLHSKSLSTRGLNENGSEKPTFTGQPNLAHYRGGPDDLTVSDDTALSRMPNQLQSSQRPSRFDSAQPSGAHSEPNSEFENGQAAYNLSKSSEQRIQELQATCCRLEEQKCHFEQQLKERRLMAKSEKLRREIEELRQLLSDETSQ